MIRKEEEFLIIFVSVSLSFHLELEFSQHEHDYLISHSHNLFRIFIVAGKQAQWKRDEEKPRVEFIILINVENVPDVRSMWNCVIIFLVHLSPSCQAFSFPLISHAKRNSQTFIALKLH